MSNLYSGYTESESMAGQRAFSRQMERQGHKIQRSTSTLLNTEAEADRIRDFITCAELNDDPRTPAQIEMDKAATDWNQQVNELRG